jgi:hypothetical protein
MAAGLVAGLLALLASPIGLTVSAIPRNGLPGDAPVLQEVDVHPSTQSVRRIAERLGDPHRLRWDGFLWAESGGPYELGVWTAGPVRLWVDSDLLVRRDRQPDPSWEVAGVRLSPGEHLVTLDLEAADETAVIELGWRKPGGTFGLMPAAALSPRGQSAARWAARSSILWLVTLLSALWLLLLCLAGARALSAVIEPAPGLGDRRLAGVVIGLAVLFAVGLWWGLPGTSWALDELAARDVRDGWAVRFSNGWFGLYPPFHFILLAVSVAPTLAAEGLGVISRQDPLPWLLVLQFRVVSLAMAVGAVYLIGRLGGRLLGPRYAWLSALAAGVVLPFAFYAKTANLEMPYVFWFALSLVLLDQAYRRGRTRDVVGAAVAAALAVATKDQAYGLYVLPAVHFAWSHLRAGRRARLLLWVAAAGLFTFAAAHNLPFNAVGFSRHVAELLGPASAGYRTYPATLAGQVALTGATMRTLLWMLGWTGLAAVIVGAIGGRRAAGSRLPGWIWLPAVSYYVTFVAVVGYVYDRFLLPVCLVFALMVALGIGRLLDGWPSRRLGRLLGTALLAMLVWRAVSLDVLLLRDGRYTVEAWLEARVDPGDEVGIVQSPVYLPRLEPFGPVELTPAVSASDRKQPRWIVVNVEHFNRLATDSPARQWLRWLEAGDGPYREVFRYKSTLRATAFSWTERFTDRVEDPVTNVDKANPEIVVFERRN